MVELDASDVHLVSQPLPSPNHSNRWSMPSRAILQLLSWSSSDIDHRALLTALAARRRKTFFRLLWPSLMTHVSDRAAATFTTEASVTTLVTKISKIYLRDPG